MRKRQDHDFDAEMEKLSRKIRDLDRTRDRIQRTTSYDASRPSQQRAVCWKCHGTGFIAEMVKVSNLGQEGAKGIYTPTKLVKSEAIKFKSHFSRFSGCW